MESIWDAVILFTPLTLLCSTVFNFCHPWQVTCHIPFTQCSFPETPTFFLCFARCQKLSLLVCTHLKVVLTTLYNKLTRWNFRVTNCLMLVWVCTHSFSMYSPKPFSWKLGVSAALFLIRMQFLLHVNSIPSCFSQCQSQTEVMGIKFRNESCINAHATHLELIQPCCM